MYSYVQFITHYNEHYDYVQSARLALEGGCKWVQLRMKEATTQQWMSVGRQVRELCMAHDAMFLLDDHVELVKPLQAHGVHLGLNDMPAHEARHILGPDAIIGGTANTFEQVMLQAQRGVNYIGCGPFRFTTTKKNLAPQLGLEGYRSMLKQMHEHHIEVPLIAIGGLTSDDIEPLMKAGVSGIAISSAILNAQCPIEAMKHMVELCEKNK